MKKIFIFMSLFCCLSINTIKIQAKYTYGIAQQRNDLCMLAPMDNLPRVEKAAQNGYDFSPLDFHDRLTWFGLNNKPLVTWHSVLQKVNDPNLSSDYKILKKYIDAGIKDGPVFPHFYKKNGKRPTGGPSTLTNYFSVPFALIDIEAVKTAKLYLYKYIPLQIMSVLGDDMEGQALAIPYFSKLPIDDPKTLSYENEEWYKHFVIFNFATKTYETIDFDKINKAPQNYPAIDFNQNKPFSFWPTYSKKPAFGVYKQGGVYATLGKGYTPNQNEINKKLADVDAKYQKLFENPNETMNIDSIGEQQSQEYNAIMDQLLTYVPYMQGLYKFMLLTLGLDNNNVQIATNSKAISNTQDADGVRPVIIALQKLFNKDSNNPWSSQNFNKDQFLEYALAEVLKNNTKLKEQLKQTVDFRFKTWTQYNNFVKGVYYNKDRKQMNGNNCGQFIPGEEQILAYATMQNVRQLWYCSHDPKAFYEATVDNRIMRELLGLQFNKFYNAANKTKTITNGIKGKASFLETWGLIRAELLKAFTNKIWISFDAHGWVVSFDKAAIDKESKSGKLKNSKLHRQLGVAGFESWLSKHLHVPYKK